MTARYYIGLATTFHDSAVSIVGPDGSVEFAEGSERALQNKRAFNCEPDGLLRMADLFGEFLPPDAEVVLGTTWGLEYSEFLDRLGGERSLSAPQLASMSTSVGPSLTSGAFERASLAWLQAQQRTAGVGTVMALQRRFGKANVVDLRRFEHHECHAAYATFASGHDDCTCLVVDGMGEHSAISAFSLDAGVLHQLKADFGRFSPGFYFGLLTDICGFDQALGEEWKMMGLAPYGEENAHLRKLVRSLYRMDGPLPQPTTRLVIQSTLAELSSLKPEDSREGWADLALAAQDAFCDIMDAVIAYTLSLAPTSKFVLGGGCALNSSYNGQIRSRFELDEVYIPSAPADDGNAIGAALLAWSVDNPGQRAAIGRDQIATPYLGSPVRINQLKSIAQHEPRLRNLEDAVVKTAAQLVTEGAIVGWMQGRAEFGPRALGNRSILGDPRSLDTKDLLNQKIKYRESFRPFAPAVLEDHAADWFEDYQPSPYMERTLRWKPHAKDLVPAVVHANGTGRLQTVNSNTSPLFHQLLTVIFEITGIPIVLNTSLNVMGKPIVHSVEDALLLFYTSGLDALLIDTWIINKQDDLTPPQLLASQAETPPLNGLPA